MNAALQKLAEMVRERNDTDRRIAEMIGQ